MGKTYSVERSSEFGALQLVAELVLEGWNYLVLKHNADSYTVRYWK